MSDQDPGTELIEAIRRGLPPGVELDEREEAILDLAARQADDVARLEADIAERGTTVLGSAGQPVLNPAIAEARQGRVAIGRRPANAETRLNKRVPRHRYRDSNPGFRTENSS